MDSIAASQMMHYWFAGTSPDAGYSLSWQPAGGAGFHSEYCPTLTRLTARAGELDSAGASSIYFRVTSLACAPDGGRGKASDSHTFTGLWADLDIAGPGHKNAGLPADVPAALAMIAHLPAPSVLVHTGGGLSAWWRLVEPVDVRDAVVRVDVERLSDAWQRSLARPGVKVDNVRDLARVMRLPGTTNRKPDMVAGIGEQPCRVIEGGSGVAYPLDALRAFVASVSAPLAGSPAAALPTPTVLFVDPAGPQLQRRYTLTEGLAKLNQRAAAFAALTTNSNQRHNGLAGLGVEFGRAVAGGFLTAGEARDRLMKAATDNGFVAAYGGADAATQIDRGIGDGMGKPDPWVLVPDLVVTEADAETELTEADKITIGGHMGLARLFARRYSGTFRYVNRLGWHVWCGSHWTEDTLQLPVRAYRDLLDWRAAFADKLADPADPLGNDDVQKALEVADGIRRQVERNVKVSDVRGVLALAQAEVEVATSPDALNCDPYLFATPGGTLDLRAGSVRSAHPDDLITKCAGAGPDSRVDNSLWLAFVERVLPDIEVRAFVQRLFGSALVGRQVDHILPVFHGKGANGKGVFQEVMTALFGTYATSLPADALLVRQHERHRAEWMPLMGARLAFASETDKGKRFNGSLVKALSGGDRMTANKMREDPVSWSPSHLLILLTNDVPAMDASDAAIWRRVCIVPFDVVVPLAEQDGHLAEKLIAILPAVAEWVWQGYQAYAQIGLAMPEAVRARTDSEREDGDVLGEFLVANVEVDARGSIAAQVLFTRWLTWCEERHVPAGTLVTFARDLEKRGYTKVKTRAGAMWQQCKLSEMIVDPSR